MLRVSLGGFSETKCNMRRGVPGFCLFVTQAAPISLFVPTNNYKNKKKKERAEEERKNVIPSINCLVSSSRVAMKSCSRCLCDFFDGADSELFAKQESGLPDTKFRANGVTWKEGRKKMVDGSVKQERGEEGRGTRSVYSG